MRAQEFLTESKKDPTKWVGLIKRDCRPYLNEVGSNPFTENALYRGMQDEGVFVKKNVRLTDRESSATPYEMHTLINKFFQKEFGQPFRNSLFVTGSIASTAFYGEQQGGKSYVIFPIGNFKFLWSPKIHDMYGQIISDEYGEEIEINDVLPLIGKAQYQTAGLVQGIKSQQEIMIRCNSYYALDVKYVRKNSKKLEALLKTI